MRFFPPQGFFLFSKNLLLFLGGGKLEKKIEKKHFFSPQKQRKSFEKKNPYGGKKL